MRFLPNMDPTCIQHILDYLNNPDMVPESCEIPDCNGTPTSIEISMNPNGFFNPLMWVCDECKNLYIEKEVFLSSDFREHLVASSIISQ
jgi:hypothetical protein